MAGVLLSIVVPLGPGDHLDRELHAALDARPACCELIIGACSTPARNLPRNAITQIGPAGRGRQLNAGIRAASAGHLWLLHADSRIEPDGCDRALAFMRQYPEVIGYGWLRFLPDGPALTRLNAVGANLRSRLFGLPYGDQGLCLSDEHLRGLGGFREDLERGEDLDFMVRARDAGVPVRPMGLWVSTSARRYADRGWLRTSWQHQRAARRLIRNARSGARASSS